MLGISVVLATGYSTWLIALAIIASIVFPVPYGADSTEKKTDNGPPGGYKGIYTETLRTHHEVPHATPNTRKA